MVATAIQSTIVTLFWLLYRSQQARTVRAEAKEDEWRRVAMRSTEELVPVARQMRGEIRDRYRELDGPPAP